jgi:hypothetical protein
MAKTTKKRVVSRDWTLKRQSPGEDRLQSTEAHTGGLETKSLCVGDFPGPPQQKEVSGEDCWRVIYL